ncbi:sensor histidine kinase [Ammoniphilus sp. YIM 78166]|uniref:cache domain-containing sensor histidine kinase n=1 Tax=Ammoniphilus sp. YIM 78166 TaxID=1644106 RepID=UPI00143196E2|nr:sensor histidine kinase [Ammoniphilus sp. YIM 78166]
MLYFCIAIIIPSSIIGAFTYYRSIQQMENQVKEYLEQIVFNVGEQVDTFFRGYDWLSLRVVGSPEVRQFLDLHQSDYYKRLEFVNWLEGHLLKEIILQNPVIEGFHIIGDNGLTYSTNVFESRSINVEKRAEILKRELPPNGKLKILVTEFGDDLPDKQLFISVARRAFSQKTFEDKGSFVLDVRATDLQAIWEKVDFKGGFLWIIDQEGRIVYHPKNEWMGSLGSDLLGDRYLTETSGSFIRSWEGSEHLFAYHTSEYTGWKMIATIPLKELQKPILDIRNVMMISAGASFLLMMIILYLFLQKILHPIRRLENKMVEAGKGRLRPIDQPIPKDEIGVLMNGYNEMIAQVSELIQRVYEAELNERTHELAKQKAELQALQSQINPHFLYNTLEAIQAYSLIGEEEPIQDMVAALASMFRYAVRSPLEPTRVRDEIHHVENFLLIQRYRQQQMPQVEWKLDGVMDVPMLRLTLQPLVENVFHYAFPHGIEAHHKIWIEMKREGEHFIVEVSDNGAGFEQDNPDIQAIVKEREANGKGIGLANVHRRIKLTYGDEYGLQLSGKKGLGATVRVMMPLPELDQKLKKSTNESK